VSRHRDRVSVDWHEHGGDCHHVAMATPVTGGQVDMLALALVALAIMVLSLVLRLPR
jgi:hypothetical protein